jgi:hypothetical protein
MLLFQERRYRLGWINPGESQMRLESPDFRRKPSAPRGALGDSSKLGQSFSASSYAEPEDAGATRVGKGTKLAEPHVESGTELGVRESRDDGVSRFSRSRPKKAQCEVPLVGRDQLSGEIFRQYPSDRGAGVSRGGNSDEEPLGVCSLGLTHAPLEDVPPEIFVIGDRLEAALHQLLIDADRLRAALG